MSRYVKSSKTPRSEYPRIDLSLWEGTTVYEPESSMRPTGLYYQDGAKVMAIDREKIGFIHF